MSKSLKKQSGQAPHRSSGQALLIVLLIMAVILTIGLSIASRSVTDISISQKENDAARAFSAAEAGVEQTLNSGVSIAAPQTLSSGGSFTTSVTPIVSGGKDYNLSLFLSSGEVAPVWFVDHDDSGNLTCDSGTHPCFTGTAINICWGRAGTSGGADTTPAVELSFIYTTVAGDLSTAKIARVFFDPYRTRPVANGTTQGSAGTCTIDGSNYEFSQSVDLSSLGIPTRADSADSKGVQVARIRMFYNTDQAHPVGVTVTSAGVLPRQGSKVEAVGTSGSATRKIQVDQLFRDLPPVFDSGVFSGSGGLTK